MIKLGGIFRRFSKPCYKRFLSTNPVTTNPVTTNPGWLIAELTYRCPLQCPYCSNPVEMAKNKTELDLDVWLRVFREARELGVMQLGFTGGEPLLKPGLETMIKESASLGFYTNLITSAVGLNEVKLQLFKENGLNSIQVSFQAENKELNNKIAGINSFEHKMKMIKKVKEFDFPLTLNIVIHRHNIDNIKDILDICVDAKADYVEIANAQYHGWAFKNQSQLLPSREQVFKAYNIVQEYQTKYKEDPKFIYVIPDYIEGNPKPCMGGWGKNVLAVSPDGSVMPCLSAKLLPNIEYPNVKDKALKDIWFDSPAFNKFRGYDWMETPCKSCDKRFEDFGGCRCQAYMLTGNMYATDPVCKFSPKYPKLLEHVDRINKIKPDIDKLVYRNMKNSKTVIKENTASLGKNKFPLSI